ncbi:hypothetical protein HanPI659440_Chr05g0190131 [Helianthus annuus]|nr:hypothetical protein HanIR_Chr05g0224831 [Helianthus annuus]KAJ0746747.1 hypothetical protein HanOQP8_Chr05g0181511 [Helianthus annuus]KAJ0788303.1 hypothetical protein HanPI659440_Chr05g0190131 [Helianthus annuus]
MTMTDDYDGSDDAFFTPTRTPVASAATASNGEAEGSGDSRFIFDKTPRSTGMVVLNAGDENYEQQGVVDQLRTNALSAEQTER